MRLFPSRVPLRWARKIAAKMRKTILVRGLGMKFGLRPSPVTPTFAGLKAGASSGKLRNALFAALTLAVVLSVPATKVAAEDAPPLSLSEAVQMTLANNPMHKAALADTKAASGGCGRGAGAHCCRRSCLPKTSPAATIQCSSSAPSCGSRIFTAQDFALNSLNRPTPIGNYASRFSGQWNLFDSTQSWKALDRAKYMNFAANEQLNRTDQELVFQTVQAYYGVLLAQKQVQVAEDAVKTVEAIEQQTAGRGWKAVWRWTQTC